MDQLNKTSKFRYSCERAQEILLGFFKTASFKLQPILSISDVSNSQPEHHDHTRQIEKRRISGFEFLNIENIEFDSKVHIQVIIDDEDQGQLIQDPNIVTEQTDVQQAELKSESLVQRNALLATSTQLQCDAPPNEDDEIDDHHDSGGYKLEEKTYDVSLRNYVVVKQLIVAEEQVGCGLDNETDTDVAKLECDICGKRYKRHAHLRRHLGSHINSNKTDTMLPIRKQDSTLKTRHYIFVCNKCGKRFSKSKALQQHENEATCVAIVNPQCRFCNEVFTGLPELDEHLTEMHPRDRPHMCPICKKTFQSVSNRNTHLQSHNKGNFWLYSTNIF